MASRSEDKADNLQGCAIFTGEAESKKSPQLDRSQTREGRPTSQPVTTWPLVPDREMCTCVPDDLQVPNLVTDYINHQGRLDYQTSSRQTQS